LVFEHHSFLSKLSYSKELKNACFAGNSTGGNVLRQAQDYTLREGEWAPPALPKILWIFAAHSPSLSPSHFVRCRKQSSQSSGYPLKGWTWRSTAFPPVPSFRTTLRTWCVYAPRDEQRRQMIVLANNCPSFKRRIILLGVQMSFYCP
jgi:hypothetical protein